MPGLAGALRHVSRRIAVVIIVLAFTLTGGAATAYSATTTTTFNATADAYVDQGSPNKKFGTNADLDLSAGTRERRAFVRFAVSGLTGPVKKATLRAWPETTGFAYSTRSVLASWVESTITWNLQPGIGPILTSSTKAADGWTNADLTSLVTGNGQVNVALTTTSTTLVTLSSRETARTPQLLVQWAVPPTVTLTSPVTGSSGSNRRPTFTGAASNQTGDSATVTVKIYSGSSATGFPVQTLDATRSGTSWSVAPLLDLADGTYTAVAEQSNADGATGASAPSTFTVDTVAPAVSLTGPADGALLAGATPTFSGAAGNQAGDSQTVTVKVYAGSSATGSPVQTRQATRSGGSWSVPASPALADGTYTVQAEQQDAAANTATSAAHSFTIDTAAPAVTLTSPAAGSVSPTATPTFSGAAGDQTGDAQTVSVNVYSGTSATGTPVQTRQATRSGTSWTVDASPALPDGTYTVQAEQQDAAGNTGKSTATTFSVNTAAPVLTLTAPPDGSSTADATPAFAGSASDRPIDSQTVTVTVYEGASAGGTVAQTLETTRSGSSWSVAGETDLADGTYTAVAQQQDTGGRTGASAPSTFTVDTSAPVVTLSGPADGALLGDSTPTFSGDAGNQTGDAQTVTVRVYAGTSATGTPVQTRQATRTGTSWTVDASPALADGTYTAQAEQQDAAGNTATSAAHSFTIDATGPNVTLTTPADGSTLGTGNATFSGAAGDGPGDAEAVSVNVYSGTAATGTPVQTRQATRSGTSWTVDASPALADGTYTAQAEQQDATGNTATSAAHTFTVNTAAPVVTLTAPADGSSTADATPAFAGSASDRPIDSQTVTVTVYEGASAGGTVAQTLGTTRSGGSWSVSGLIDLADGTYTAVAQQQDTGGRTGASAPSTFTVDTSAPVVTLSGPADGALVGDSTPTFSGDAGNQTGDAQTVTVKVYAGTGVSGSPVQTRQATRSGGSWSVPASPALADGTYTAQAEQQDAAGNTATSAAHSFTIDTTAPAVTLTAPAAGSVSTTATPTFSGAAGNQTGDAQTVTVNVYSGTAATGTPVQTRQATRTGTSWTVDASPALADGTYTAQAEQQDAAGNTGKSTPATTFSINTAAPPSAYAEQILSDSPRAYWRLGEASGTTADDATPNGNAGGYSGGPQLGQPGAIAGDPNKAVTFDGVDDHMLAPDTNSLDVTAGSTVEAWVKRSKNLQYQVIVGKPGNGQSKFENYALWLNSSNQPAAYFGDGTTYASVTSSTPIDTNWHHLVATYDNQAARLYIDGALSKSVGSTVQLTPNASPLNLARSGAENTYRFGGQLDEVAVYGTALSATRIRAHYDTAIGSDTVGPDVTLTSPADGSRSDTGNVTFGGAAGNAPGDSPTVTVKVYSGQAATGTPVQTRQATRSGSSWTVDASPALANGTYTARAEQGDTAGNTGFSAPTTFTVGPPPPPPGPSPYRDEVMSDSPRAFWRLGETSGTSAIDETANHNNGTYAQGVQLGVPGAIGGESNGAASFDGIDDYMGVPDTPSLDLTTGATVEAWVKRSKGANWQVLVGKPGNGQTRLENYALWLNSSDFLVGYFGNGTAYAQVESTGPLNTNWHHVVVTYNNQTARLYIDGVLNNSTTSTVSLTANALPLHLARASDNSFLFGGRLDEVAVYGTALTAARVQAHYQTGLGTDTTPPDVTLTTPEAGSQTTDTTPAFAGMAAVTGTDSSTVTVKVYSGSSATGTPVRTMTTTRAPIGTWNVSAATALGAGTYTVQAEQQDTTGNVGRSAASTFTIGSRQPLGTGAEFIGAGDIAYCDDTGDEATAALLDQFASATVFTLGDNAYESGTTQEFNNCYQPSWGRAKARTRPSLGDHDYADGADPNGTGYFAYFATQLAPFGASATDPNRGYYSYDLGSWHVVVLNAVCGGAASGCNVATQIAWLRSDLAAHPASCTAALMSAPRYSSGSVHGNNTSMQNYWSELAQAGVEFVMSGDDHDYERFAPMDVAGQVDPNGMRQLVIGTGGRSLYPLVPAGIVKANSEVREDSTYGILRLVLRTGAYEWEFIPQAGKSFVDSGSDTCH